MRFRSATFRGGGRLPSLLHESLPDMIVIESPEIADILDIEALLDAGFGPARHNRTAYRLREDAVADPALSFVARHGHRLAGSVQCWPIRLGAAGADLPLTLLGPLVVAAEHRGQGVASALMHAALGAFDAGAGGMPGSRGILLIGDLPFYARFGFDNAATGGWRLPGPVAIERLLLRGDPTGLPRLAVVGPDRPRLEAA